MNWKKREYDKDKEKRFVSEGCDPLVARLLAQRLPDGVDSKAFVSPEYNSISHPYEMNDMEKAVDIFMKAVLEKKRIAAIGDYDCDGVLSSVMLKELCHALNYDCDIFLPSRLVHNYGLNPKSLKSFIEKHKDDVPDLLFLLDCGSNNKNEIEELREWGVKEVIVIDHHNIYEEKGSYNADAFVTWHLSKGKDEMCTVGLIFQFIRGIRWKTKKVNPISFIAYAAIGTIADVSPIVGDNRVIVKNGLTGYALNNVMSSGLHALIGEDILNKGYLTQDDVAFKIAPRINAVGRIEHPELVYDLIREHDVGMAEKMAPSIVSYNEKRKQIQKQAEIEASQLIDDENNKHGIFAINENWHIGVAGIVASRLVETYHKPTIVVGRHDGVWRGSGRSVQGVNIRAILDECKEMFISYGGHDMACGLALKEEYADKANEIFNNACKKYYDEHNVDLQPFRFYDAQIKIGAINYKNAQTLINQLAPYCNTINPEPIFRVKDVNIRDIKINKYKNDKYIVFKFKIEKDGKRLDYPFMSFNLARYLDKNADNKNADELTQYFSEMFETKSADLYFRFPQNINEKFELMVDDLVL